MVIKLRAVICSHVPDLLLLCWTISCIVLYTADFCFFLLEIFHNFKCFLAVVDTDAAFDLFALVFNPFFFGFFHALLDVPVGLFVFESSIGFLFFLR